MTRIIPGVQVSVVKEVVPPQLSPSGVLGIVGFTETSQTVERASSWASFIETVGAASAYSIPEARQALENGVFQLVISPLSNDAGNRASADVLGGTTGTSKAFTLTARAAGVWANHFTVQISQKEGAETFDLALHDVNGDIVEQHRRLSKETLETQINSSSQLVTASKMSGNLSKIKTGEYAFKGGEEASVSDYEKALSLLENEADVDMVIAAVGDFSDKDDVVKIYSKVIAHCERMSADSNGRIGFGQVSPTELMDDHTTMVEALFSDRFVMVAPHGVVGAVAGRIGSLNYFKSPTFKTVAGLGVLNRAIGIDDQRSYLDSGIVPVITQRGRGTIILRGLTTDKDQISVRRVADRAVRGMKMLGDLFIGRLNNEDGRNALKQKLIEFLVQMEKEGAIVPKTDGSDPAFKVDVYSSQADFAKGIVRVDMAVRPVRAIDFIYATILVQV